MPRWMLTIVHVEDNETLRVEVVQADDPGAARAMAELAEHENIGAVTSVTDPSPGVNEHLDLDADRQVIWSGE